MKKKVTADTGRVHVFYVGRVQGVGFRYTAEKLALDLKLTGWVKNLPDGRVELVCEGPKKKIEELLSAIKNSALTRYIQAIECAWEESKNEFKDFTVEFCLY